VCGVGGGVGVGFLFGGGCVFFLFLGGCVCVCFSGFGGVLGWGLGGVSVFFGVGFGGWFGGGGVWGCFSSSLVGVVFFFWGVFWFFAKEADVCPDSSPRIKTSSF